MRTSPIQHSVVVGAGAVGSFFGAMLARAGHQVTLIGRPAHVQAIQSHGLQLDLAKATAVESVRIPATTDLAVLRQADLVLFCVKSTDTAAVAHSMAAHVAPQAIIMSLQNGVENAALIASALPNPVIPAVVYVATEISAPGCLKHHGRGELVIGTMHTPRLSNAPQALADIVALFASAQVPVQISQDVMVDLWSKLLINCVFNAISGLAQTSYGKLAAVEAIQTTQVGRSHCDARGIHDYQDHGRAKVLYRPRHGPQQAQRDRSPQWLCGAARTSARRAHAGEPSPVRTG